MKKLLLIIILFPLFTIAQVQWAKQIGGPDMKGISRIAKDNQDHIYITGGFRGNKCYFENDTLTAVLGDLFLAQYNLNGSYNWTKHYTSTYVSGCIESTTILMADTNNNCLYAGIVFCGTLTLDTMTFHAFNNDFLIIKFDLSGNVLWAKQGGGLGEDVCHSAVIDNANNLYVYCSSSQAALYDTTSVTAGGYLLKINAQGDFTRVKRITDYTALFNPDYVIVSMLLKGNEIYAAGGTNNDTLTIDTILIQTPNKRGGVLSCFNLNCDIQWHKKIAYPNGGLYWLAGDVNDNIYISGNLQSDSTLVGNQYLTNNNMPDAFLVKLDANDSVLWVNQLHASGGSARAGICVDNESNVYFTGIFNNGTASFGGNTVTTTNSYDMFLARYDSNGNCLGEQNVGIASGAVVITDNAGNPYAGGTFSGTTQWGSNTFTCTGIYDGYLAKYNIITGFGGEHRLANNELVIYANPNAGKCNITVPDDFVNEKNLMLSIYDNTGKLIQQKTLEMNEGKIRVNLEQEAKGVYNVTLANKKKSYNGKIVFE